MDLEFTRGDNVEFTIELVNNDGNQILLEDDDKLYMTVKKNSREEEAIFQKKIGNGIEKTEDGKYLITILPEDTNGLDYGEYGYDIQLIASGKKKTLGIYTINLTEEYTHVGNEV